MDERIEFTRTVATGALQLPYVAEWRTILCEHKLAKGGACSRTWHKSKMMSCPKGGKLLPNAAV